MIEILNMSALGYNRLMQDWGQNENGVVGSVKSLI
jgi:hypothetical protein